MRLLQKFVLFFKKTFTEVFGSFLGNFLVNYKKSRNFAEKLNKNHSFNTKTNGKDCNFR
jgi:hypothetical protein